MDPIEVRQERVATQTGAAVPVGEAVPVERGFPVHPTEYASEPSVPATTGAAPVAAAPVAPVAATPVAPVAAAPVVPVATTPVAATRVTSTRVGVYPAGYRAIQLIWLVAGVVDLILALDFVFRAANANNTGFAHYIYRLGGWLAAPFNGIFSNTTSANGTVLRWGDVLAVVIYTVAAWIITRLVRITATPRAGVGPV